MEKKQGVSNLELMCEELLEEERAREQRQEKKRQRKKKKKAKSNQLNLEDCAKKENLNLDEDEDEEMCNDVSIFIQLPDFCSFAVLSILSKLDINVFIFFVS